MFAGTTNANIDWVFTIAKNGTPIPGSRAKRQTTTSDVYGSTAIHCMVKLSTNDYLDLFVQNTVNTAAVVVSGVFRSLLRDILEAGELVREDAALLEDGARGEG